jgi:hypothetical protein
MSVNVPPKDIRKLQSTIENMAQEMGVKTAANLTINGPDSNEDGKWAILYRPDKGWDKATGETLEDAYIQALHDIAGTEEAPF